MFNASVTELIKFVPWRYTTQPTYNPDATEATPGVKETLNGVFVRIDEGLITELRAKLTAAQKTAFDGWVYRVTEVQAAEWHLPLWAGETSAVFLRVPAEVWSNLNTAPPALVKTFFARLWREAA